MEDEFEDILQYLDDHADKVCKHCIAYKQARLYARDLLQEMRRRRLVTDDLQHFAYVVSHDLQEPIRTALNYFQLIENALEAKGCLNEEDVIEYATIVKSNLMWTGKLIDSLLYYSRLGKAEPGNGLTLCELFDVIVHNLQLQISDRNATLTFNCECVALNIADVHMQRLLQNLVMNSLKYCDRQPVIEVGCSSITDTDVTIYVKDNGIGIDSKYYDYVFQIFKRLDNTKEGTGIGLTECKRIAETYNGKIWLESEVGTGTTVYCLLPKLQL